VDAINPGVLAAKGSLFLTRPTLNDYVKKREDLEFTANALFTVIEKGIVRADINQECRLSDVASAHADLESRATTGATVLIP
jgi:NADPH2:quinone reductase